MAKFKTDGPVWILTIKRTKLRVIVSKTPQVCVGLIMDELCQGARMSELELCTFSFEGDTFIIRQQANAGVLEMAARMGLLRAPNLPLPETAFELGSKP